MLDYPGEFRSFGTIDRNLADFRQPRGRLLPYTYIVIYVLVDWITVVELMGASDG